MTPNIISGGIGLYRSRQRQPATSSSSSRRTNIFGGHQLSSTASSTTDVDLRADQRAHRSDLHDLGRPQTATGAQIDSPHRRQLRPHLPRDARQLQHRRAKPTQKYYNFFVQDSVEGQRSPDRQSPASATSSRALVGTQLTLVGRRSRFALKNNWAPRLGVIYDVLGNGRSKLYANYGRLLRAHSERPRRAGAVGGRRRAAAPTTSTRR